jgi:hypothetical protein
MSTKTNFKRLALVVVSALGFGFLSVVPSSATATNVAISTPTAGTATFVSGSSGAVSQDTTTAASFTVTGLITSAYDTITVRLYENTKPATATNQASVRISPRETTTAATYISEPGSTSATLATFNKYNSTGFGLGGDAAGNEDRYDSETVGSGYDLLSGGADEEGTRGETRGNIGATFNVNLDSGTTYVAGAYTYTVLVTTYSYTGNSDVNHTYTVSTTQATVTINVAASSATVLATAKTPAVANATAYIGPDSGPSADTAVTAEATASTTPVAYIKVSMNNTSAVSGVAEDSLTATITGPGLICDSSVCGKALSGIALISGTKEISVRADGTAGVATITISSTVAPVTFPAKTVTFYAAEASTISTTVRHPVLKVGANSGAVGVTAADANGIAWTGTAYIYATSAASALIAGSETPAACTYTAATGIRCDITGKLVGTATFKVIDASTVATATASSAEFTVTVSAGTPGSVRLAFDKAEYAPFEKAKITVTVLDTEGKALPAQTVSNALATGGISTSVGFSQSSDTLTATSVVLQAASSSVTGAVAGSQVYFVYMPASSGTVTISAVGGTGLPAAAQVAVSASAKVVTPSDPAAEAASAAAEAATDAALEAIDAANAATDAANLAAEAADAATVAAEEARDAADAATAAVEALAGDVATLMAALKAQITTLAKTVAKIAKKVKA